MCTLFDIQEITFGSQNRHLCACAGATVQLKGNVVSTRSLKHSSTQALKPTRSLLASLPLELTV